MADDQQGRDSPRDHDDLSGKTGGDAEGNGADAGNPDALDDLLGTDVRDAGRVLAFDRLRSDGLTTDQAVQRMINDGILAPDEGPGFAYRYKDRPVQPKRSSGKANGAGTGTQSNGRGKANGQAGNPPGFDAEATSRLTSWLPEIAIDLGLDPGRDLDIRPDGSWHCRTKPGYGDGALDLIRHIRNADADAFASNWLAAHPEDGLFNVADDLGDNSAEDQGRQLEVERIWQNTLPAPGTIADDFLVGLGFDTQTIKALKPDIGTLCMVDHWSGGDPALAAPITASNGSVIGLHLQALDRMSGAAKGEPHNKRGKASWIKDGLIRLGNHGEGAQAILYLAETLADALALRAAGRNRVAAPPRPDYLGRATVPPDIAEVVVVGPLSVAQQRGLVRLLGQGVQVKLARLPRGATAMSPADLRDAVSKADGRLWRRGDDTFFDELYRLDEAEYGRAKPLLKKVPSMVPSKELDKARAASRRKAFIEAEQRKQAEEPLVLRAGEAPAHHEAQDLARLLDDIVALLERYLFLPPTAAWVLALFAVYTGVFDLFPFALRIWLHSAEPESGKTTAGLLTLRCCPRWKRSDSITEATFHRFIAAHPDYAIFINEANAAIADGGTLVDLICSGFEKGSSVDRTEKSEDGKFTPSSTSPFCPVILAGLEQAAKAVQSRCVVITMVPPLPDKTGVVSRMRRASTYQAEERTAKLASRVARWAADNREAVAKVVRHVDDMEEVDHITANGVHPPWVSARELDKLLPLFVIAHLAGGDWPARMEQATRTLSSKGRGDLGQSTRLLLDSLDIIHTKREKLASLAGIAPEELLGDLLKEVTGTWQEFVDPKRPFAPPRPITATLLGKMLSGYQIVRRAVTEGGKKRRYYPADKFLDAFRRYLVPGRIPSDTAAEVAEKVAAIDAIFSTRGFSARKPGHPVRPLGNKGDEPSQTRSNDGVRGPSSKQCKPLRRKRTDRRTGFEGEKTGRQESRERKAPKKRRSPSGSSEPKSQSDGEDI